MKQIAIAFLSGLLFSSGLVIGGMTIPENIIGFLDLAGTWRPALAFVMIGAIGVFALAYPLISRKPRPIFDSRFHLPETRKINSKLVWGSIIFGIGWGTAGFCPGPALTALGAGVPAAFVFVPAMVIGMILSQKLIKP